MDRIMVRPEVDGVVDQDITMAASGVQEAQVAQVVALEATAEDLVVEDPVDGKEDSHLIDALVFCATPVIMARDTVSLHLPTNRFQHGHAETRPLRTCKSPENYQQHSSIRSTTPLMLNHRSWVVLPHPPSIGYWKCTSQRSFTQASVRPALSTNHNGRTPVQMNSHRSHILYNSCCLVSALEDTSRPKQTF